MIHEGIDMQKTVKKDIFKILTWVLAVIIVFAIIIEAVLVLTSENGIGKSSGKTMEITELKSTLPAAEEIKTTEKITIRADGSSKKSEKELEEEITEDYVIADSNSKILTSSDISGLSAKELNYAKNEIYARHGRKFSSEELQKYFESKTWYEGKYEPSDFDSNYSASVLSDTEKKNTEFLKKAEEAAGGYKLDQ